MKMPAVFKGLNKDEAVQLAVDREKDIKKKSSMRLASLVETHKQQKTLLAGTAVGAGMLMEGVFHSSETAKKYEVPIAAVAGLGGVVAGALVEEETAASLTLGIGAAGLSRVLNAGVRLGIDKYKESRAEA